MNFILTNRIFQTVYFTVATVTRISLEKKYIFTVLNDAVLTDGRTCTTLVDKDKENKTLPDIEKSRSLL